MENNLSTILGSKRISVSKLQEGTGISRTTLHRLYHEKSKNPDSKTVMAICKYLNVTPNEFWGIEEKEAN